MGKTYMGRKVKGEIEVWMSDTAMEDMKNIHLLPAINILNLALNFDWGNESPETQQLAVTILNDYAGPEAAQEHYQAFAREFLAPIDKSGWHIEEERIIKFLNPNLGELDDGDFEIQEEALNRLRESYGFTTRWSLYDQTDLEENIDFEITRLTYNGFAVEFAPDFEEQTGFPMCWRDLWRAADFLYQINPDKHHVFVEGFEEIEDGVFELRLGS